MPTTLTSQQEDYRHAFRVYAQEHVHPMAGRYDTEEHLPREAIEHLATAGYLGGLVATDYGGLGLDAVSFGLLNEEIGRGCSSLRSIVTVHSMVAHALARWGRSEQKDRWLSRLADGSTLGAFALTEPAAGSDAARIGTAAEPVDGGYSITGDKRWITGGQLADLFLVFAESGGRMAAFLVERGSPGLTATPVRGLLGVRASMLADLRLQSCFVPRSHLVGAVGFGLHAVAAAALDVGRYSVAWGSVGIAQGCVDASLSYASTREQGGALLRDYQLIRQLVSQMFTNVRAARLLCLQAGRERDAGEPASILSTLVAKYFASRAAMKAAADSVQIHGANGCSRAYPVERYFRDAKIMEIIEGSNQMQELMIADAAFRE
jgi:alkylation response protein AidB-like acyl-CoA dehydrogenase